MAALALSLSAVGCALPDLAGFGVKPVEGTSFTPMVVTLQSEATQIRLRWQPASDAIPGSISKYNVYFRRVGALLKNDLTWTDLAVVPASESPGLVVDRAMLGDGDYEFAVSAIGAGGESIVHRSSDTTARPATGWVLRWRGALP